MIEKWLETGTNAANDVTGDGFYDVYVRNNANAPIYVAIHYRASDLRAVVQVDHQTAHPAELDANLLPPDLQAVHPEIAGLPIA